jgi:hypothetical protein
MESCNPLATFHQVSINLGELKRIFKMRFTQFEVQGYFRQDLGCTRAATGFVPGPVQSSIVEWSEEDLFATIKFLHSHVSKPIKHNRHRRKSCGRQRSEFDRDAGRAELRQMINRALRVYNRGFELLKRGDISAFQPTDSLPENALRQCTTTDHGLSRDQGGSGAVRCLEGHRGECAMEDATGHKKGSPNMRTA